jgi:ATP-dependent DNA helicase RecQ
MLGPAARAILKGEEALALVAPPARERSARGRRREGQAANPVGDPLFDALRALRRDIAQEIGVPPYVIFHDSVLRDIAAERPANRAQMGRITGVGARKLEAYGDRFLQVVRDH